MLAHNTQFAFVNAPKVQGKDKRRVWNFRSMHPPWTSLVPRADAGLDQEMRWRQLGSLEASNTNYLVS